MPSLSDRDQSAIDQLREECADLLGADYDTDFNLLRWAQGYNHNLSEAVPMLRKHLKFRRFYDFRELEKTIENDILHSISQLDLSVSLIWIHWNEHTILILYVRHVEANCLVWHIWKASSFSQIFAKWIWSLQVFKCSFLKKKCFTTGQK